MEQKEYLDQFEQTLLQNLLQICTGYKALDGQWLNTPDIDDKWADMAPSYVADAMKEIHDYPLVSMGWAMYVGMAVAQFWEDDWQVYSALPNLYLHVRDKRGFDYLDEVVRGEILGLADDAYTRCEDLVRSCAQHTLDAIRHEQIEPASPMAFYAYARCVKVMYKLGAAVHLKALGYKFERINS